MADGVASEVPGPFPAARTLCVVASRGNSLVRGAQTFRLGLGLAGYGARSTPESDAAGCLTSTLPHGANV